MNKSELIHTISEQTGIPKVDILVTLEQFFVHVKSTLTAGEEIHIRGFGTFHPKKRAAKIGRNIKRNTTVEIPEHFIPAFKPAKEFSEDVKRKVNAKKTLNNND
ncbi:MAG: HU family DNA-binding protein [Chitinophagaceae bacterium]